MTKNEALSILKCETDDEVHDAFELALFDLKNKVLQQVPPLKLIRSIINKVERINNAYSLFDIESNNSLDVRVPQILNDNLVKSLKTYQDVLSGLRLDLTKCFSGVGVVELLNSVHELQSLLFIMLEKYCPDSIDKVVFESVKLSDSINVFMMQQELSNLDIDDNEISEYIRVEIGKHDFESCSELTKSIVKAKKQVDFNGLN
jgi:hypothetical protein